MLRLNCHPEFISGSYQITNYVKNKILKQVQNDKITIFGKKMGIKYPINEVLVMLS